MKINFNITLILTLTTGFLFAQERTKDTIDDQTVNVVKPYTPTISDAFKIKDKPNLEHNNTITKKEVKYNIFSIPVASTFTPAKGSAANVEKAKPARLYDNYATLGFGTYTTILGELYLNHELSSGESIGGYLSHHSSQGGIDGLLLDDHFSKSNLNVNYGQKLNDFSWKIDLGGKLMTYNWYGLPQHYFGANNANSIDPEIKYSGFNVGGRVNFQDAFVQNISARFRRFGDDRESGENRFLAKANFEFPISDELIKAKLRVDYLDGSFERNYNTLDALDYGNFNVSLAPTYQLVKDDLTVDLGVQLTYLNDTELNKNKLFLYPNIEATYRLVSDILIGYAGINGDLIQNTYENFVGQNPFVSPTLLVTPTDQQYHGFVGLKGRLSNTVSYNLNGNYYAEENKPLFKANDALSFAAEDYQYGNSFKVVYDTVKTFSIGGELNVDVNRNFKLGIKGEYFSYNTSNEAEAWNLPNVKGSVFLDYQIAEKWFMGGSIFYTGERKDETVLLGTLTPSNRSTIGLDSFFDANAHVGYRVTDFLSVYAKANNIANQDYQRWSNFPVQGLQLLAGATYQFDF